ncbi:MAG: TetR/AcrR family transcriptional regulator, partial [Candidatus Neomarinimicrobiota bacterium]|nr:TetR/AcrR family transcriptional regulator [Candidatus Neomarinimicrobiota bacterium]
KLELQDQRKEQIMSAALSVVVSKGYDQSRMDDIVEKSQLSKGAIYWYYKSKEEVYLSLVDYWFLQYSSGVVDTLQQQESASDQLKALFDFFIEQFDKNPTTFKLLVEFWRLAGLNPGFNAKLQQIYSDFLEYIIEIIKVGVANGEFKNVEPRITALSILINIEGINWFTLFDKSGVEAHEYIDTISNFILNGLKKKRKK